MRYLNHALALGTIGAGLTTPAAAQVRLDRADPSITEQALPRPAAPTGTVPTLVPVLPVDTTVVGTAQAAPPPSPARIANAIVIDGNTEVANAAFATTLVPYLGRDLSREDLTALAGAVATVARQAGYPFASATIGAQTMTDGVLHVALDEGRIAAVRVIGAVSPVADRLLTAALVTGRPVRRGALERAILLVGDIPGLSVTASSYTRQDGFGILLVTVVEDRASAYVQVDNRGSAEVGPLRATMLASLRGIAGSGDELGLIVAATPVEPSEFAFLRARYAAPVDASGGLLTVSGSYGRAKPGATLKPLDVVGNSFDLSAGYTRPVLRSRTRSLWTNIEFRALKSDQTLLDRMVRDDRLTTLTGSLNGTTTAGPGVLRGEVSMVGGLPLAGVTHQGDARTSRADGDARFVAWGYALDWTTPLAGPLSMMLASSGQLASRPLLATMEIGAGGPAFGRGYDYAERTGDQGILGSAELRASLGRVSTLVERAQLYGFVDGGYVDNLRGGIGGGSLLSTGTGARLGHGLFDAMVEIAFPLNEDRFDTGTKRPRVSFRLSRGF